MDRVRASRSVILWIGKYNAEDLYLTPRVSSASTQRRIAELHPMVSGAGSPLPGAVLLKPWPLLSNFVRCAFEYLHSLSRACAGWRGCSKGAGRRTIAIGRSHLCTSYHQSRAQPCGKGRTPHGLPGRARLAAFAWPMLLQCHTASAAHSVCSLAARFASSDLSRGASRGAMGASRARALLAPGVLEAHLRVAQQPRLMRGGMLCEPLSIDQELDPALGGVWPLEAFGLCRDSDLIGWVLCPGALAWGPPLDQLATHLMCCARRGCGLACCALS